MCIDNHGWHWSAMAAYHFSRGECDSMGTNSPTWREVSDQSIADVSLPHVLEWQSSIPGCWSYIQIFSCIAWKIPNIIAFYFDLVQSKLIYLGRELRNLLLEDGHQFRGPNRKWVTRDGIQYFLCISVSRNNQLLAKRRWGSSFLSMAFLLTNSYWG